MIVSWHVFSSQPDWAPLFDNINCHLNLRMSAHSITRHALKGWECTFNERWETASVGKVNPQCLRVLCPNLIKLIPHISVQVIRSQMFITIVNFIRKHPSRGKFKIYFKLEFVWRYFVLYNLSTCLLERSVSLKTDLEDFLLFMHIQSWEISSWAYFSFCYLIRGR